MATSTIHKLEQPDGGRWYANQVRIGDVQNSGDELRADRGVAPVLTSVYRHFVEFDQANKVD